MRTPDARCSRCGNGLYLVFPGVSGPTVQYDNALVVSVSGGYGMFVDDMVLNSLTERDDRGMNTHLERLICHECAHELCVFLKLTPANWHTHNPELAQHQDHHKPFDELVTDTDIGGDR